jgi:amino acid transporter
LLWGLSVILEFLALIILRRKEPSLPRPFRIPGPEWMPILLGLGPTAMIIYALHASRSETVAGISAFAFALTIAAGGLPVYFLAKIAVQRRKAKTLVGI